MSEKIHKALARAGYGSRRRLEEWIREGRVTVNGRPAHIGERVSETDRIAVDGAQVTLAAPALQRRVIAYHKPEGEICTASGLVLATNDGELAHRLMHPSGEVEREYAVRVLGRVTPAILRKLTAGVKLEDGRAWFEALHDAGGRGANHWYHVVVREGRNRLVRRLWESQGLKVSRLIRVRYGPITLPSTLKAGHWKELAARDLHALEKAVGLAATES